MPLASGSGKRVISGNIRELMHAYAKKGAIGTSHPADAKAAQKQAIAIAYSKARKRAAGGRLQPMADGGTPFYARQGSSALAKSGMIQSAVAGRTDKLPMKVRGGSYVVPADVVSGLGQGNSLAGAAGFDKMLKSGPYGADKSPGVHVKAKAIRQKFADGGATYDTPLNRSEEVNFQAWKNQHAPYDSGEDYDLRGAFKAGLKPDRESGHWPDTFKKPNHPTFSDQSIYARANPELAGSWQGDQFYPPAPMADGGEADDSHAEIIAAGGEYIIDPDQVRAIGGGDLKRGHEILDHAILHIRKKTIKQMRRLPRPKVK